MMTVGLLVSMFITFTLLPSALTILSKKNISYKDQNQNNVILKPKFIYRTTQKLYFQSALIVILISAIGITKLGSGENSFINYFNKETEKIIKDLVNWTINWEGLHP